MVWPLGAGPCRHTHSTARTLRGAYITGHAHPMACTRPRTQPQLLPTERPSPGHCASPCTGECPQGHTALQAPTVPRMYHSPIQSIRGGQTAQNSKDPGKHTTTRLRGGGLDSQAPSVPTQSLGRSLPGGRRVQFCSLTLTEQFENWGVGGGVWSGTREGTALASPHFICLKPSGSNNRQHGKHNVKR